MRRVTDLQLRAVILCGFCVIVTSCTQSRMSKPEPVMVTFTPPARILDLKGAIGAHDPAIIKADGIYYRFITGPGIPIGCSPDLISWTACGRVFNLLPIPVYKSVPGVKDLWAPDISFFGGKYHLYYAASTFGSNHSAIALATNTTLDATAKGYKWIDEGVVLESRENDNYNAIDPNFILDQDGRAWLAFGSFWTGIKIIELDPATGKVLATSSIISLAQRSGNTAIEAPFVVFRNGYYYLFVSFDQCCNGVESTYNIRVGRSKSVTGPYIDRDNTSMLVGGGSLLLVGNATWRGPGHNSVLIDEGTFWLVYHAYDIKSNGVPLLHIESLDWDSEGWPHAPSAQAQT